MNHEKGHLEKKLVMTLTVIISIRSNGGTRSRMTMMAERTITAVAMTPRIIEKMSFVI